MAAWLRRIAMVATVFVALLAPARAMAIDASSLAVRCCKTSWTKADALAFPEESRGVHLLLRYGRRIAPVTVRAGMKNYPFPTGRWGEAKDSGPGNKEVERVRIEPAPSAGFVIITKERSGTFDVWVETENEVLEYLESITVLWESE